MAFLFRAVLCYWPRTAQRIATTNFKEKKRREEKTTHLQTNKFCVMLEQSHIIMIVWIVWSHSPRHTHTHTHKCAHTIATTLCVRRKLSLVALNSTRTQFTIHYFGTYLSCTHVQNEYVEFSMHKCVNLGKGTRVCAAVSGNNFTLSTHIFIHAIDRLLFAVSVSNATVVIYFISFFFHHQKTVVYRCFRWFSCVTITMDNIFIYPYTVNKW